jgi:hypothetical protein
MSAQDHTPVNGLPNDWRRLPFEECFAGKPRGATIPQIAARKATTGGELPVIGQGQSAVEGYTNATELRFPSDLLPVIIFGPHTRIVKAVRHDFVSGPNVRYLWPVDGLDFDFSVLALNSYEVPSRGYNDHFPLLKEAFFNVPPLPEQKKITHILSTLRRGIEVQERIIQTTTELKKALMHKLFAEGLRNEPQKQTEIGPVPESWEVVELGDVINLFAGYAFKSDEGISESNTQLLRMGNLYQNTLDLTRSPIFYPDSFAAAYKRFVLKEGDLVMSLTGTSGKEDYGFTVRIRKTDKTLLLNQRVTRIDVTDHRLQKGFAHHFLLSRKFLDHLYPTAKGMKQANLSTNAMKKLKLVLPSEAEQSEIATCFESIDQKVVVAGRKVAALQDLFRTLLHELMTARTNVHEFEFETPPSAP